MHTTAHHVSITAPNWDTLVKHLSALVSGGLIVRKYNPKDHGLAVVAQCGRRYKWRTYMDIPRQSLPCPCGNEMIIEYTEES